MMDNLKIHIEVTDVRNEHEFCYSSQIIPRIGEDITWFRDGKRFYGRVASVTHEVCEKQFVNHCQRVWVKINGVKPQN